MSAITVQILEASAATVILRRPDGTNIRNELEDKVEAGYAAGGDHIVLAPGLHNYSSDTLLDIPDTVVISGPAARLHNLGPQPIRLKTRDAHGGISPGPKLRGIWFTGTPEAEGGLLVEDTNQVIIQDCKFTGFMPTGTFDPAAAPGGYGVQALNPAAPTWTEGLWLLECKFTGNRHDVVTTPNGNDAESFARLRMRTCTIGRGAGNRTPHLWLRGGVYHSSFRDLSGNLAQGDVLFGFGAGWANNTLIEGIGFECGGSSDPAALFADLGGWPGPPPILGDGISALGNMIWGSWSDGVPRGFTARVMQGGISLPHQSTWPSNETDRSKLFANSVGVIQYRNETGNPITL